MAAQIDQLFAARLSVKLWYRMSVLCHNVADEEGSRE
jgi:hypothetical protein